MEDELDMETQLERELAAEQEELLEVEEEEEEDDDSSKREIGGNGVVEDDDDVRERESILVTKEKILASRPGLAKVRSLPANFIYNPPRERSADGRFKMKFAITYYNRYNKLLEFALQGNNINILSIK